jgi:hypothetical protein
MKKERKGKGRSAAMSGGGAGRMEGRPGGGDGRGRTVLGLLEAEDELVAERNWNERLGQEKIRSA